MITTFRNAVHISKKQEIFEKNKKVFSNNSKI